VYSVNGKFTQEKESDILQKTEDHSCIFQKELEISVLGKYFNKTRKLKAQRLRWTTAWRRLHKKIKVSDAGKAKKQKALKL
jgi:hypothetical protein